METAHDKGEAFEHELDDGQQVSLANALGAGDDLPLGDDVHRIDVIDALGAIEVALVNGVNADVARKAIGSWGLANRNVDAG